MATVIIKEQDTIILQSEIKDITPLGFDCVIPMDDIQQLRDDCGRYRELQFSMVLNTFNGPVTVNGLVSVYSVRRASQSTCMLTTRFVEIEQGAYRLISEHIGPSPVGSCDTARALQA